jgi:phenylacetate-coenzyme A ligase PaaK-like adenylate-forming protein
MKPNVIIAVPPLTKLIQYAEANGIDYRNSSIKKAILHRRTTA